MTNRYRQFEALQERTLERLRYRIPHDCPLRVERRASDVAWREFSGFRAVGPDCEMIGRAAVVTAFIDGYVAAWRQADSRRQK